MATAPQDPKRLRRFVIPIIGVGLSVAGLAYVYKDFDVQSLLTSASRIQLVPLVGTVAAYWLGTVLLRALLLRHLLKPVGAVGVPAAYRYLCVGFLANNVLPARAGDVARSAAIHRGAGLPFSSVVGSLALERMLDMGMVAAVALTALQLAPLPTMVRNAALGTAGAVMIGLAVIVVLARREWVEQDGARRGPLRAFAWSNWVRFSAGLRAVAHPMTFALALLLIVGVWGATLACMAFRLEAFGIEATPALTFALLTCLGFGVAVPSAPGYIGVYHWAALFALTTLNQHPVDADPDKAKSIAQAFAMFSWILDVGIGSVLGAVSLSIEGLRLGDLKRRPPAREEP